MPIFAHVNEESSFLHTLSVTDGKKFVFCTRSRLRTEKNSRPPAATSKELKLCVFPITDGTKNRFLHTLSVTEEKKSTRAFYFLGARLCRPAFGRCPPQSGRDRFATEKEDARTRFFFPPCWRAFFLLLLWKYVKGVSPHAVADTATKPAHARRHSP